MRFVRDNIDRLFPLSSTGRHREARRARKMLRRRGGDWMRAYYWVEPAAVKPSKRGRRG